MKKLSGVFICLLLFTFISSARIIEVADAGITDKLKAVIVAKNAGGAPAGATDYTQDANCMAAWYMNGASGGDGTENETDRCNGGSETLVMKAADSTPDSATVPAGYAGSSRDFEMGDYEYMSVADGGTTDISGADQALSICVWIKFESDPGADATFVWKHGTSGNFQYYLRHDHAANAVEFRLSNDGTTEVLCYGTVDMADDTDWHHVCGVYNDIDIRLYHNGSLDSNGANNPKSHTSGIYGGTEPFYIGARSGSNNPFDGLIDEIIVLDRALSAEEVLEIYNNGISGNKGGSD